MIVGYDFMTYETCPYRANTKDTSTAAAKSEQILGKFRFLAYSSLKALESDSCLF